jgi:hypothetical protein
VALQVSCLREQIHIHLKKVIGRHQARNDRRRARAQASRQRDLRGDPERERVSRVQALERAHAQVLASLRHRQLRLDRKLPRLDHLKLQVQRQRRGHAVEAGAEVRR